MALRFAQILTGFLLFAPSRAVPIEARAVEPSIPDGHWVDTWTAMPQLTEYTNLPPPPFVRLHI